jgi:ABC-2 type transport system ATP-binding protein
VNGHDVFDEPLKVRESLGYLPQRAPLYLEMSVLEYLRFAADLRHLEADAFRRRARDVVEVCGLAQVLGKEIRHLSHGYRQRVGLAQALIHNPPVMILDEPTIGLDPRQIHEIRELIRSFAGDRTIVLSTHILPEVSQICDRVVIINDGRIALEEQLSDIPAGTTLEEVFLAAIAREDHAADTAPEEMLEEVGAGHSEA